MIRFAVNRILPVQVSAPVFGGSLSSSYRPDIDGLRAVAILPVVLFHAGASGFSGGFVGVDIFFVISGFLITGIIHSEIVRGNFSLLHFYERRARRILPALLSVVLVTYIAASVLLLPSEFEEYSGSVLSTTLFASNVYFWSTLGYFRPAAELSPLLHTWSLAVEEQFYIFFPLLLMAIKPARKYLMHTVLGIVFVASMLLSIYWVRYEPQAAFYLAPARAWELAIGSYLALIRLPNLRVQWLREAIATVGALLIAIPVVAYSHDTAFPGLTAIAPCVGTAALIYTGTHQGTWVSRALSRAPVVWFGLISYSLYLWHWPILAFLRIHLSTVDIGFVPAALALLLSVAAAYLSHRFVEAPFRRSDFLPRQKLFGWVAASALLFCSLGLVGWMTNGASFRFDSKLLAVLDGSDDVDPRRKECFGLTAAEGLCTIPKVSGKAPTFLLWGDSHAAALMPAVTKAAEKKGQTGLFVGSSACPPLLDVSRPYIDRNDDCQRFNEHVIGYLKNHEPQIKEVIIAARWALAATGERAKGENGNDVLITDELVDEPSLATNPVVFERGLGRTVSALSALGKSVIMLEGVPEIGWNVPITLAREQLWRRQKAQPPTLNDYRLRNAAVDSVAERLDLSPGFRYVRIADLICDSACRTLFEGRPTYSDDDHLSLFGAEQLLGNPLADRIWPTKEKHIK